MCSFNNSKTTIHIQIKHTKTQTPTKREQCGRNAVENAGEMR